RLRLCFNMRSVRVALEEDNEGLEEFFLVAAYRAPASAQFVRAQGGGVKRRQEGPVLQVAGVIQDASDFLGAQDAGQSGPALGPCDLLIEPLLLQVLAIGLLVFAGAYFWMFRRLRRASTQRQR